MSLIPIQIQSPFFARPRASGASLLFLLLVLIAARSLSVCCHSSSSFPQRSNLSYKSRNAMKIHPLPTKRNIRIQFDFDPATAGTRTPAFRTGGSHKKLRRLPHIFSRVLELPFRADADVAIEESPDCFKFVAETDGIGDVSAHTVEIHPGVIKIVIRPPGHVDFTSLDDLELDMWRFRLPESTRPELASAVYEDGELIVTVPKGGEVEEGGGAAGNGGFRGGMGNGNNNNWLVLVQ